jgi:hypothetical protein
MSRGATSSTSIDRGSPRPVGKSQPRAAGEPRHRGRRSTWGPGTHWEAPHPNSSHFCVPTPPARRNVEHRCARNSPTCEQNAQRAGTHGNLAAPQVPRGPPRATSEAPRRAAIWASLLGRSVLTFADHHPVLRSRSSSACCALRIDCGGQSQLGDVSFAEMRVHGAPSAKGAARSADTGSVQAGRSRRTARRRGRGRRRHC